MRKKCSSPLQAPLSTGTPMRAAAIRYMLDSNGTAVLGTRLLKRLAKCANPVPLESCNATTLHAFNRKEVHFNVVVHLSDRTLMENRHGHLCNFERCTTCSQDVH